MGKIGKIGKVKLFCGIIFSDNFYLEKAKRLLIRNFGIIDFESQILPFNYTRYYEAEMGGGLKRFFVSFKKLIHPKKLAFIKRRTNLIEQKLSVGGRRSVNLDPGYLDKAKVVLASTKDYCHRIYIGKGIFAEVTLRYVHKSFQPWDWTYPDYKSKEYLSIFSDIRALYVKQLNS
ncbi:MAG: DUF4416 family protein [Candidatus Omnitrophica bacterium]|nr:DUF4416 family protein [Candidatus Omnitrophota bacterium]